jgi:hypothetical protein
VTWSGEPLFCNPLIPMEHERGGVNTDPSFFMTCEHERGEVKGATKRLGLAFSSFRVRLCYQDMEKP